MMKKKRGLRQPMKINSLLDWFTFIVVVIGMAFLIYKSIMFYNLGFAEGFATGYSSGFNNYLNSCQLGSIHG